MVQECSPVFHRLRLSASAKGPTNPERINLAQETLGLRRAGFSPAFSLLMPASALPEAPHVLAIVLRRRWNAPLPLLETEVS